MVFFICKIFLLGQPDQIYRLSQSTRYLALKTFHFCYFNTIILSFFLNFKIPNPLHRYKLFYQTLNKFSWQICWVFCNKFYCIQSNVNRQCNFSFNRQDEVIILKLRIGHSLFQIFLSLNTHIYNLDTLDYVKDRCKRDTSYALSFFLSLSCSISSKWKNNSMTFNIKFK